MEFTGRIVGLSRDVDSSLWLMTIEMSKDTAEETVHNRYGQDVKVRVQITKWFKKRTKDANAYLWGLCSEIAKAVKSSKDEVYEEMLKRYGTFYKDENGYVIVTVKASVDMSKVDGHWKFCGEREDGKFKAYMMIKGSSEYDTKEMSDLLDGVICEAKQLGIPTTTKKDYQRMIEEWGKEYEKAHKHNN